MAGAVISTYTMWLLVMLYTEYKSQQLTLGTWTGIGAEGLGQKRKARHAPPTARLTMCILARHYPTCPLVPLLFPHELFP